MADVSSINFGDNVDRNVKDSVAREKLTVIDPTQGEGLITFGVDADGNYGYKKVGADTVTPFKTGGGDVTYSPSSNEKYIRGRSSSIIDVLNAYADNNYFKTSPTTFNNLKIALNKGDIIILQYMCVDTYANITINDDLNNNDIKYIGSPTSGIPERQIIHSSTAHHSCYLATHVYQTINAFTLNKLYFYGWQGNDYGRFFMTYNSEKQVIILILRQQQ